MGTSSRGGRALQRKRPLLACALFFALLGVGLPGLSRGAGFERFPVWCYSNDQWLMHVDGVPGSASMDDLISCLAEGAISGDLFAIEFQEVDDGYLIDLGVGTLFWEAGQEALDVLHVIDDGLGLTVRGDCLSYEVRLDSERLASRAPTCTQPANYLRQTSRRVTSSDLTVYASERAFVVDGEQGRYVSGLNVALDDRVGSPQRTMWLTMHGGGIWTITAHLVDSRGRPSLGRAPILGVNGAAQEERARDWVEDAHLQLLPKYFENVGRALWEDWEAYWAEVTEVFRLMAEDLFGSRAGEYTYVVRGDISEDDVVPAGVLASEPYENFADLFVRYVQAITDPADQDGLEYVANAMMLWNRYVPYQDIDDLRRSVWQRYAVPGEPVAVQGESELTERVTDRLFKHLPSLPSSDTQVAEGDSIGTVVLEWTRPYTGRESILLKSTVGLSDAYCAVVGDGSKAGARSILRQLSGSWQHEEDGVWNGLDIYRTYRQDADGGYLGTDLLVAGTPTHVGRTLIQVDTSCGPVDQGETTLGYVEILVVDSSTGAVGANVSR